MGTPNRAPKAISSYQSNFDLHEGINFIHLPLKVTSVNGKSVSIETLGDLYDVLTGVNYLVTLDRDTQRWMSYHGNRDADRVLQSHEGIVAFMNNTMALQLTGESLDATVPIQTGTNFVGIPRLPTPSYSVSDLLLSNPGFAAIVVEENGEFKTVVQKGDDGDVPITGGQSFILIASRTGELMFSGEVWGEPDDASNDDDDDSAHKN